MRRFTFTLSLVILLIPAMGLAQGNVPPKKTPSKKARLAICEAVYGGTFKIDLPIDKAFCLAKTREYLSVPSNAEQNEAAFIGPLSDSATSSSLICKVYLEKLPLGTFAGKVETCQKLAAPRTCSEKVAVETQKALVRRFPAIAQSFGLRDVALLSSAFGVDSYSVVTTDEVESVHWEVETSSDASPECEVKSVRFVM